MKSKMITGQQLYTGISALDIRSHVWNAAIYCRLSVEDQNLQESGSIQTQRAILTDYCRQNGINVVDLADGKITQAQYDERTAVIDSGEMPFGKCGATRNKEQSAARETMKAKWNALTDNQKAEIYSLYDQKVAINSKIVDKYLVSPFLLFKLNTCRSVWAAHLLHSPPFYDKIDIFIEYTKLRMLSV